MSNNRCRITMYVATAVAVLILAGPLASEGRGDFTLRNSEQLTVDSSGHMRGWLYDQSKAWIVPYGQPMYLYAHDSSTVNVSGGYVDYLYAYNGSTVNISSGEVDDYLDAYDSSSVNVSGGKVYRLRPFNSATANISGGFVPYLEAYPSSTVNTSGGEVTYPEAQAGSTMNISGGSLGPGYLRAYRDSVVIFIARDFDLGPGLSLNGDRVLGTGDLSGEWFDGTPWTVHIGTNHSDATILAIPEPATVSLLTLGGLAMLRRRKRGMCKEPQL